MNSCPVVRDTTMKKRCPRTCFTSPASLEALDTASPGGDRAQTHPCQTPRRVCGTGPHGLSTEHVNGREAQPRSTGCPVPRESSTFLPRARTPSPLPLLPGLCLLMLSPLPSLTLVCVRCSRLQDARAGRSRQTSGSPSPMSSASPPQELVPLASESPEEPTLPGFYLGRRALMDPWA